MSLSQIRFISSLTAITFPRTFGLCRHPVCAAAVPPLRYGHHAAHVISSRHCVLCTSSGRAVSPAELLTLKKQYLAEEADEAELAWETGGLQFFSTHTTPEEKERAEKTKTFLRVLLVTADEQEWRDMLTAAVQLGTWKAHHMDATLRGIVQAPDEPTQKWDGNGAASSYEESRGRRHSRVSTASQRLQRAHDIIQFWWELAAEQQALGKSCVKPSEAHVYNVLLQLLRAAQSKPNTLPGDPPEPAVSPQGPTGETSCSASTPSSPSSASSSDRLPHATYAHVWRFLAWMESHGYHLLSTAIVPELEAAVDNMEEIPSSSHGATGMASASGNQGSASRYALVSRRVNRLEYLNGEKEWIRRREKERRQRQLEEEEKDGKQYEGSAKTLTPPSRRVERPRVEPSQ